MSLSCRWLPTAALLSLSLYFESSAAESAPSPEARPALVIRALGVVAAIEAAEAGVTGRHSRRVGRVEVDSTHFRHISPESGESVPRIGIEIELQPFPDESFLANATYLEATAEGLWTWVGAIRGYDNSEVVLTMNGNRIYGVLRAGPILYEFQTGRDGNTYVREPDLEAYGFASACVGGIELRNHPVARKQLLATFEPSQHRDEPRQERSVGDRNQRLGKSSSASTTVDVLVMYSPAVAQRYDVVELANNSAASMNASFQTSNADASVRIVGYELWTDYQEKSPMDASAIVDVVVDMQSNQNDFEGTHALRDVHASDVVIYLFDASLAEGTCGAGYIGANPNGNDALAFSTTGDECIGSFNNFAHEIGHNLGGRHDVSLDPSTTPYEYCHGYSHTDPDFMTIMGSAACTLQSCDRLNRWSEPNQSHLSIPLGVEDESDMAQCLDDMAEVLAAYRSQSEPAPNSINDVWVTRGLCFSVNSVSWSAANGIVGWYEVQTSLSSNFQSPQVVYRGPATALGLHVFQETYVRTRACNGTGCSAWTNGDQSATYTEGCL
jgi:hypothetical protein